MGEAVEVMALKIDTTLNTHLLTMVPVSFTVSEAKRKIESEHSRACGRKTGEIRVDQLQVMHMGHQYCLPDDMILADAFTGYGSTSSQLKPLVAQVSKAEGDAQGSEADTKKKRKKLENP